MDPTRAELVHSVAGQNEVTVERDHTYRTDRGELAFHLYRPRQGRRPAPAVVFVSGYADPGMTAMLGRPLRDWASYQGWARMVAALGIAGITYENREPADVHALMLDLRRRASELRIDPDRIGVWACSGHVPMALGVMAADRVACAALLYGFLLDLDGATAVADAARQFRMTVPPVSLGDLPRELPILLVRAGRDATPGLNQTLQRFAAAAEEREMRLTVIDHVEGQHAFDLLDPTPRSREVLDEVLAFLRQELGAADEG
jgi:dienelactone hydrolase